FFFFSSRRRHTRFSRDWSRRVLFRSLLLNAKFIDLIRTAGSVSHFLAILLGSRCCWRQRIPRRRFLLTAHGLDLVRFTGCVTHRSEERRVGKEGRSAE